MLASALPAPAVWAPPSRAETEASLSFKSFRRRDLLHPPVQRHGLQAAGCSVYWGVSGFGLETPAFFSKPSWNTEEKKSRAMGAQPIWIFFGPSSTKPR